jgi:CBS domain containing-hemolysin-like protein
MASIGQEEGMINDREFKIIRNLFLFKSVEASTVMTPRIVVPALQKDLTVEQALADPTKALFSRLPIYSTDMDSVVGFVLREDQLVAKSLGQLQRPVSDFRRDIVAVIARTRLSRLMETLLGIEILDEGDKVDDMQKLARQL